MYSLLVILGGILMLLSYIPIFLGFGTAGVARGSLAASLQSFLGSGKGSLFATLTSLGMRGIFTNVLYIGAFITLLGIAGKIYSRITRNNPDRGPAGLYSEVLSKKNDERRAEESKGNVPTGYFSSQRS